MEMMLSLRAEIKKDPKSLFFAHLGFTSVTGSVAQLDRASHYGCEGLRFESLRDHKITITTG